MRVEYVGGGVSHVTRLTGERDSLTGIPAERGFRLDLFSVSQSYTAVFRD